MEGETINPERPHNQKRPRSPQSHRPRASAIKAKQHPVKSALAALPVKSAVPTDESTGTSSDDENEEYFVENATPSTALIERMPRPEMAERKPPWKNWKKNMKNGGDDGEGGKTYKQLYESRNSEFQEMMQERDRVTGINAKLQEDIQTLKTAATKAEIEKALFQKDFDAKEKMLAQFKEDNKELKAHVFRTHHQSTYGATGSMSVRGPSPNENTPT